MRESVTSKGNGSLVAGSHFMQEPADPDEDGAGTVRIMAAVDGAAQ